jgi:hypothetical protein
VGIGHSVAKTGVYLNRMSTKHSLVGVCAAVLLFVCFVTISKAHLVHRQLGIGGYWGSLDKQ